MTSSAMHWQKGRSCGNLAAYLLEEALRRHHRLG